MTGSPDQTNEAELVARLRRGDPAAIEQLFKTYFDRLYSLVFNQVGRNRAVAEDGEQAVRMTFELVPDVVIMDLTLPKLNGLEATRQIKAKFPDIAVLALTIHTDSEHILGILLAGASGYLSKSAFAEEVVSAIRAISRGEAVMSRTAFQQLLRYAAICQSRPFKLDNVEKLTPREVNILKLAGKGMSNKDIAQHLNISVRTVKGYLVEVFSKLRVASRTEAVLAGLRLGLFTMEELEQK